MTSLVYPLKVSGGSVVVTSDVATIIGNAITSVLLTEQTERPYRPTYGYETDTFKTLTQPTELLATCRSAIDHGLQDYGLVDYQLQVTADNNGDKYVIVQYFVDDQPNRLIVGV